MAVSLKGSVILSAVKENPTIKRTCGTPADKMAAGRRTIRFERVIFY